MDTFKSKTYETDYENAISESNSLKYKDVKNMFKDGNYAHFISQSLQKTNLRWLYFTLSAVLLMEMITGYLRFSAIFEVNYVFRIAFITVIAIHIILGGIHVKIGKERKYAKSNDVLIYATLFLFIIFQCFFYYVGATNNQSFFYFISASVAIATIPSLRTKFMAVFSILNYIVFIIIVFTNYKDYSLLSVALNAFYVSLLTFILSVNFFISKVNMLINEKKLSMFAKEMAVANDQLNYLNEELEKLSFTDTLTNISNRRAYEIEIEKMWSHNMRSKSPVTIMMIDIDFFKDYNDYFGHPRGDVCLSEVAICLQSCFKRRGDIVARLGGEEFVVALSSVDEMQAPNMAERIIESIRNLKIEHPKSHVSPYVTVSVGVVSKIPERGTNPQLLLDKADMALYKAKKTGRNKFHFETNEGEQEPIGKIEKVKYDLASDTEKLRMIIKSTTLCTFSIDYTTGKIEFSNDILKIMNLKSPIMNGFLDLYDYIFKDDIKELDVLINSLFDPNFDKAILKFRIILKNNETLWVKCPVSLVKDESGRNLAIVGSFIDINDEVKEKKELVYDSFDGIFKYNLKSNSGTIDGEFKEKLPLLDEENENNITRFFDSIYPSDKLIINNLIKKSKSSSDAKLNFEIRVKNNLDEIVWISVRSKINFDYKKEPVEIEGTIIELDKLTNYNKSLRTSINQISGFPDRAKFHEDFENRIKEKNSSGFLFIIDVDNFSSINNIFTYSVGNKFLKDFALRIDNSKRYFGKTYHFDGDIFAVIFPNMSYEEAINQMEIFNNASDNSVLNKEFNYNYTFSMACIQYPEFGQDVDDILKNGDIAINKIKNSGKNSELIFSKELLDENVNELTLEKNLRECVQDSMRGFMLYYHPLLSAKDNICIGAEALLRWKDSEGNIMPPIKFIPVLEKIGLMNKVGEWVLKTASSQCKEWIEKGSFSEVIGNVFQIDEKFSISVNITAHQLIEDFFEENLIKHLNSIGLECKHIILELTESDLLADFKKGIAILNSLRKQGIRIAIDDFGTGYSSLSYLRDLPVDEIKIDKSFITDIENDGFNREFVNSIIKISQSANRIICIEGVENHSQVEILRDFNANVLQGFLFSKPIPNIEFEEQFLRKI